jgi:hypothetical protein
MNAIFDTYYVPQPLDLRHHLRIDGIELVGAIERDRCDVILTDIELH